MKKFSFSVFNIIAIVVIVVIIIFVVCPFNLIDMEQAERIAKWKSEYKQYKYCFSLVDRFEGSMIPGENLTEDIADDYLTAKISNYLNLDDTKLKTYKHYIYRNKNGRFISKHSQFYFDTFVKAKDGAFVSFKKNINYNGDYNIPVFLMFIDINGRKKPNRIGQDIFFIDIFEHNIKAVGYDKEYTKLKQNCSPIGSGIYCSEFYLLGGHF